MARKCRCRASLSRGCPFTQITQSYHQYATTASLMISSFIAAIAFAVAHHLYYTQLHDQVVGSPARQQWALRFGTALAFLVQACLVYTTGSACAQWIWRRCRQQAISIGTIDAAFAIDRNVFMLLNPNLISKFPAVAGLAVVFWCLPLSSLITPATLGVELKPNTTSAVMLVNQPSISNYDYTTSFAYHMGPKPITEILQRVALSGEQLPLTAPGSLQNASYAIDAVVPVLRCRNSNDTVRLLTAAAVHDFERSGAGMTYIGDEQVLKDQSLNTKMNNKPFKGDIDYYGKLSSKIYKKIAGGWNTDMDTELWISVAASKSRSNGTLVSHLTSPYSRSYFTCAARNASMTVEVSFLNGAHSLRVSDLIETEYCMTCEMTDSRERSKAFAVRNYNLLALEVMSLVSGWITTPVLPQWPLDNLYFRYWRGKSHYINVAAKIYRASAESGPSKYSGDKNLTTLIEEFSLNVSLSLMALPGFSNKVPAVVNQTTLVNKYTYHPQNLFIAYGCSISACLITLLAGMYAICTNGEAHDNRFSSISKAMQSPDVAALFKTRTTNIPVPAKMVATSKIRLQKDGDAVEFRTDTEFVALEVV